MLGNDVFYHGLIKKYITLFGSIFSSLYITRTDEDDVEIERMKVPLIYASKDKMMARLLADPNIDKKAAVTLPRMSFFITNITPDTDRNLNKIGRRVTRGTDANHMKVVYNGVAHNFDFTLYVYVNKTEDGTRIVEQIMPFFKPDFTTTAAPNELVNGIELPLDLPIIYVNCQIIDENQEGQISKNRIQVYALNFVLKGWFFGPAIEKPIIKFVKFFSRVGSPSDTLDPNERIAVYPGLTANGEPTSNGEMTIDVNLIEFDDEYGYIDVVNVQPFPANTYPFDRSDV
jgi:hypothetical protein